MKQSFLNNDRIYLRAVEPEDLDVMYEMENDPSMWDISNFTVPYSRYVLRQYIEGSQCDVFADKQLRLMIISRSDHRVLGTIDITDFVPLHARGEVGIAVSKADRQQGYASDALRLLCEYAFDFLSLTQLYAHVATDNEIWHEAVYFMWLRSMRTIEELVASRGMLQRCCYFPVSESEETLIESRHSWKAGPGFILAAQFFQGFFPHILGVTVHQVVLIFFRDEPCVLFELVIQLFAFPAAVSQEEADVLIYFIALQDVFLYLIKVSVQIQTFADGYCAEIFAKV